MKRSLHETWKDALHGSAPYVALPLMNGNPPIHIQNRGAGALVVSVWMLRGNEHRIVARRLQDIFR
jgi:hypothetical protein